MDQTSNTPSALAERFTIETETLSTLSTQGFTAIDRERGGPVFLLMLRSTLAPGSEVAQKFITRLHNLSSRGVANIIDGGIDPTGVAFAVLSQIDGAPFGTTKVELSEAERRFISAARIIERIHAAGEYCGDLSPFSFWINRTGEVTLTGCLGVSKIITLPSPEEQKKLLPYCAPEVVNGVGACAASDVYSLGMMGCLLLAGSLPDNAGTLPANLPPWAATLFGSCCDLAVENRPKNVGALFKQLATIREDITHQNEALVITKSSSLLKQPINKVSLHATKAEPATENPGEAPAAQRRPRISQRTFMIAMVSLVIVFSIILGAHLAAKRKIAQRARQLKQTQLSAVTGNSQLERAVEVLANPDSSIEDKKLQLKNLSNSDDPLAHGILVQTAHEASTEEERLYTEHAVIERARRLGLNRASEQARQWLRSLHSESLPPMYEAVLTSLDGTLPLDKKKSMLTQVYARDPMFAVKLTAALALDAPDPQTMQPILGQFIADISKDPEAVNHSLLALVLSDETLSGLFGDDIIQRREQLTQEDILWLLPRLAGRNDNAIRPLATLALERNLVPPIRSVFLTLLRDRSDLPNDVIAALVRASAGVVTVEDIGAFGRWYDGAAEPVLFALCAEAPTDEIRIEAFDTLAGKSLTNQPGAALVGWVRENRWSTRDSYAKSIGILAHADKLTNAELARQYESFGALVKESELLEILVQSTNPAISKIVIEKNSNQIGLGGLINLLEHPDADVRITAIKALKGVNDLGILKMVKDRYALERDERVRAAYRENLWVIK